MRTELETCRNRSVLPMGLGLILVTLVAALAPARVSFAQGMSQPPKEKTLYQRMGGYDVIAAIVDDFIKQLGQDEAFKRFGGGRSMDSLHRTRQLVVDQICYLAGGPCQYIGRDTKTAHAGLAITDQEWDLSIKHFKTALDDQKVAEAEQKDFIAMIEKLKNDVVEKPKGDYPPSDKSKASN